MPKFLALGSFRGEATAALLRNPGDREQAVRTLCEAVGGQLVAFYLSLGPHDFVMVVDAPDHVSMAAGSMAAMSTAAYHHIETVPLIDADEMDDLITRAREAQSAFRPPGQ